MSEIKLRKVLDTNSEVEITSREILLGARFLLHQTLLVLLRANEEGDLKTVLAAVREAVRTLEFLKQLVDDRDKASEQDNVLNAQTWPYIRERLISALERFPEARAALVKALKEELH